MKIPRGLNYEAGLFITIGLIIISIGIFSSDSSSFRRGPVYPIQSILVGLFIVAWGVVTIWRKGEDEDKR